MAAVLATLVVCALAPLNLWPFSNWELFSRLRSDQVSAWQAVAVDAGGRVRDLSFGSLPHAARGVRVTVGERDAVCDWLRGPHVRFGDQAAHLRIYHVERVLSDRQGERAAPPRRMLAWTCTATVAREPS